MMAAAELDDPAQARLVARLAQALAAQGPVQAFETHVSRVLVSAEHAWKFKKPIAPGFLDYTTRERRRRFCDAELALNRRLAPELYLDVVAVTGTPEAPRLGGDGEALDWALRMRAFAQDGLWDRLAARGALGAAQVDALVAVLARFHAGAAVAPADGEFGHPERVRAPLVDSLDVLDTLAAAAPATAALGELRAWQTRQFARLQPVFAARLAAGRVRECHGDLHLGNVVEIDGRTTVFDCIEFNEDFRWIDVASEVAFMAMDLHAHGLPALAHRFVDGWMAATGDYDAARVLRYYLVHRALVRAKVAALRAAQPGAPADAAAEARRYIALALQATRAPAPVLLVTHGVSGSGKTTLTQPLVEGEGALRVRADVERKRLFGLQPLERPDAALKTRLYGAEAGSATYARLLDAAGAVLDGGFVVVLDATFLHRAARDAARRFAAARGARFVLLDFAADDATLRARVAARGQRGDDASDADLAVLAAQQRSGDPLDAAEAAAALRVTPDQAPDWPALLAAPVT
ncbi:AAA family ATPase [Rubrivivax sp. JA1055]|nr:AAA family ATPase [Rubrivivax sp. JA1055]